MANLRGGTFDKQVRDAFHRLESFGVSRHGSSSHKTHSDAIASKREMYLRDYQAFAEERGLEGKLNQTFTTDNMSQFLQERLEGLARSTQEDYTRGWSSMVQGLQEANVSVPVSKDFFDSKVAEIKSNAAAPVVENGRAITNVEHVIRDLYEHRFESGVIAEVALMGYRISEAIELVNHPDRYIQNSEVFGLVGKGNHTYDPKPITPELTAKIALVENVPSENTFRGDLSTATDGAHTPHDFRYTYAEREFNEKIATGVSYHEALKAVSEGLNHSREEMTNYYLQRA